MSYYQANVESPLFPDLRGLLLKTAGLVDVLADALKPVASKVESAFVFGSMATGDQRSDSDVDVMIVGAVSPPDLALSMRCARDLLGREINPTIYTSAEFKKRSLAKDHFLTNVLNEPKLFILGDEDDLGAAAR